MELSQEKISFHIFFAFCFLNVVYNPLKTNTVTSIRPGISPSQKTQNQISIAMPINKDNGNKIRLGNLVFK
jgi:hypothetical protein